MQVSAPLSPIDFGGVSTEALQAKSAAPAAELASEFESVFVAMLLKQMRQAFSEEGLFPGDSGDTFGGLFDMHLSQHISESGGIGLSEALGKYLAHSGLPGNPST